MNVFQLKETLDLQTIGNEMYELISELYPICRSITGNGVRQTLEIISKQILLEVHEVPTGTRVFDWTVPPEWNIKDAYVKNSNGEKIIDFQKHNLHVLNYSMPVHKYVSLRELKEHLSTLPEYPDWIPYRTSYYNENWGFCIAHNQLTQLEDDTYEVCIDSTLEDGHLTYGEYFIRGKLDEEVLVSTHVCHPSLCNDNLSGIALVSSVAKHLSNASLRYSYRFLFIPGTIGSINWLCSNEGQVSKIKHGLVVACVGDSGGFTYKKSRKGDAEIDKIVPHVSKLSNVDYKIIDFFPYGYDERQFCSPGFDLPVGCFLRTPHGEFPQYHTSADNLEFVRPENLALSFSMFLDILCVLENNLKYVNLNSKCEPQLGRRGLYDKVGAHDNSKALQLAMLWVLNLSDGNHNLLDIAERAKMDFSLIKEAADILVDHELLKEITI